MKKEPLSKGARWQTFGSRHVRAPVLVICMVLLGCGLAAEKVREIRIEGLGRTEPSVVLRELGLREGDDFDADTFAEGVQRLKNLQIFAEVESRSVRDVAGQVRLELRLAEKWTLIPIAKFGGGGGTAFATFGAYDVNVLGRYLELGAQYENLDGISSAVAWFREPRLFGQRLRLGGDVWNIARNHLFYGQGAELQGGYTLERFRCNLFVDREFPRRLTVGLGWTLDSDRVSEVALSDEVVAENRKRGLSFSEMPRSSSLRLYGTFGRLDWEGWLVQGTALEAFLERSSVALGAQADYTRVNLDLRSFVRAGAHNFGLRLAASSTDAPQISQETYLGGLDSVRGFVHERFHGRAWWLASGEARIGLIRSAYFAAQGVAFLDLVAVDTDLDRLLRHTGALAAGAGAGMRLIFPRIYRLNLRLDYGWALDGSERGVSFGLQQFF